MRGAQTTLSCSSVERSVRRSATASLWYARIRGDCTTKAIQVSVTASCHGRNSTDFPEAGNQFSERVIHCAHSARERPRTDGRAPEATPFWAPLFSSDFCLSYASL